MTACVLLVDANAHLADAISELLNDESGFRVVGVADTADAALALLTRHRPDIVLVDPRLDATHRSGLCAALRAASPRVVLLLWSHSPSTTGADRHVDGILQRGMTFRELVVAIRRAQAEAASRSAPPSSARA